jgi:hypothetical protein
MSVGRESEQPAHDNAPQSVAGSAAERRVQREFGTERRANAFYRQQMLSHLNAQMREFIGRMDMMFLASSDATGACDASFRAGASGFVRVLDEQTLAYPEYRGNGVMASLGNIAENGHVGMLFVDFFDSTVGLHVNGRAEIVEGEAWRARFGPPPTSDDGAAPAERWVVVSVEEAYIHCAKHIPRLGRLDKMRTWGTDDAKMKGGDYFGVSADRRGRP